MALFSDLLLLENLGGVAASQAYGPTARSGSPREARANSNFAGGGYLAHNWNATF